MATIVPSGVGSQAPADMLRFHGTAPYLDTPDELGSYLQAERSDADFFLDFGSVPAGPLVLEVQAFPHISSWFHVGMDPEWFTEYPASNILCHYSAQIPDQTWGMATFETGLTHEGGPLRLWMNPDSSGVLAKISYLAIVIQSTASPRRVFPRDDALTGGARRVYPPPKSEQRGFRAGPGSYL